MIAGANREVLFRFKGVIDPSVKRSLNEIAQLAAKTENGKQRLAKESTKAQAQAAREEQREVQESMKLANRREKYLQDSHQREAREKDKALRQVRQLQQNHDREIQADARDLERSLNQSAKSWQDGQKKAAREHQQHTQAYERNVRTMNAANTRLTRSLMGVGSGVLDLGRGFAMLGVMGEKDTEKLLRALVKIQIGFDLLHGGVMVLTNLRKAWLAYAAAVNAAAAAGVAAKGAGAIGAAGAPVAAIAAGVATFVGIASLGERGGHKPSPMDAMRNPRTPGELPEQYLSPWEREKQRERRRGTNIARQGELMTAAEAARARGEEFEAGRLGGVYQRIGLGMEHAQARAALQSPQAAAQTAMGQLAWAQQNARRAQARPEGEIGAVSDQQKADEFHLKALDNGISAMKEMQGLAREMARAQIEGARVSLEKLQEQANLWKDMLREQRQGMMSGAERAGRASPEEVEKWKRASAKAQRLGVQALNREELSLLEQVGPVHEQTAKGEFMRRGAALLGPQILAPEIRHEQFLAGQARAAELRVSGGVQVGHNITVRHDNLEAAAKQLADQLGKKFMEMTEKLLDEKLAVQTRQIEQRQWQQQIQAGAAAGG